MSIDLYDLGDPRPDHERADDAALGISVSHAARALVAEGHSPRAVATAFLSTSLAISLSYYGQEATVGLLTETADDVAQLRMGSAPHA